MLLGTQKINDRGHLEVGGCDTVELAREHGTPLYVVDEDCLRQSCRDYRRAFESRYPSVHISFSSKAFTTAALCRVVDQEGLGVDVSSGGELQTALHAGVAPQRIFMHGSNKSRAEMEMAITAGVGRLGIDHLGEIDALQEIAVGATSAFADDEACPPAAGELRRTKASCRSREAADARRIAPRAHLDVLIRVTPGVTADTHTHIQTGRVDTKFGFPLVGGAAMEAAAKVLQAPNLRLCGINCHIGSQIFDLDPFREAAEMMVDFAAQVRDALGLTLPDLDLGGGIGVRYREQDHPPSLDEYAEAVTGAVRERCRLRDLPLPRLIQEPGRRIVGEAGVTLYTIGVVKEIPGIRTYVSVDGGLSDNPRPALYDAKYDAIVANKAAQPRTRTVTVAGKHCETDTLITDLAAPQISPGDILAVQTTGAYNYSMSSNYNRLPRPAVVLVQGGKADVIVERETLDDLLRQDRIPPRLEGKQGV
jgi:diaminopimelate decarboxylase